MAARPLVASLSVSIGEEEEENVQVLKRKWDEMPEEQNELKIKVSRVEGGLLYNNTQMKAMRLHLERLEEHSRKLYAENESIQVTKRNIVALMMNCSRVNRSCNATKMK